MKDMTLKEAMEAEDRIMHLCGQLQLELANILEDGKIYKDDDLDPLEITASLLLFAYTMNREYGKNNFEKVVSGFCPIAEKLYDKHIKQKDLN